ncbi:MAG: hypothetical protein IT240_03785, partial [Bacteroidia bacterium]|nr:hypothetical protein [Bacteroidia bacterium]
MKFHYVKLSLFSAFVGMAYFITSCDGNGSKVVEQPEAKDTLMSEAQTYFQVLPAEEPGADQQAKILLGRTLFHDVRLSKNNTQ